MLLAACSARDPSDKSTNNADSNTDPNAVVADSGVDDGLTDVRSPDAGITDVGLDAAAPDAFVPGDIPESVTSAGAEFAGSLAPQQSIDIRLSVFQSDRVTMWLRQVNGTSWDPSINVLRDGVTEPLVWGNPSGNEDASIPFRASELEDGYEFWFTDTYTLRLENRGQTQGDFTFTMQCRGGPCAVASGDSDVDGTLDASDPCPYRPGDCDQDPYSGLSNAQLEDAIRGDRPDHVVMNYTEARVHLYAWIDKVDGMVEGIYTGDRVATDEIPDAAEMNTEHGWPQSRSGGDPATESDLHHLFPTKPDANSERASLYFGEVVDPTWQRGGSSRGRNAAGDTVFEPRDTMKGDLARTLFYYAVAYDQNIRPQEEDVLRQWNVSDPPDDKELRRNQAIANVQRSRNPFVDDPSLADRITDF